jgi:hypothetical protein
MAELPSLKAFIAPAAPSAPEMEARPEPQSLDQLRELGAEVQDLQTLLEGMRKGETTPKVYADYIRKTKQDIDELVNGITDGDSIRHLHNIWEMMSVCPLLADPEPEHDFSSQEQLHHLNTLDTLSRKLAFQVGMLTIPQRLNNWLAQARPGYYVPFHSVFEDELPALEDRERLLNFLAWQPKVIEGGLVDATTGLVYKYSQKRRWTSYLLLLAALAVTIGLVIGSAFLPVANWPIKSQQAGTMLVGWVAVLAGLVVHAAVGTVKRAQARGGRPPVIAIADLPLQINAKIGQLLLKLLLTLVGLFGLAFTAGAENVTPLNTFLIGYSLDSVVELFSTSIEQQAAAQVGTLKQQLGVTTEQ